MKLETHEEIWFWEIGYFLAAIYWVLQELYLILEPSYEVFYWSVIYINIAGSYLFGIVEHFSGFLHL